MGNQVTVNFLTDAWDQAKKDPKMLVRAIDVAMNYGTDSMSRTAFNRLREGTPRPDDWPMSERHEENRYLQRGYVTVHQYRHADEVQIIINHANSSTDVWDFAYGVSKGFLETRSNPRTYVEIGRSMVDDLRGQAAYLEKELNDWEKAHPPSE